MLAGLGLLLALVKTLSFRVFGVFRGNELVG